ncbi:MAG: rod shape-determining protein RodA, partial [Proteobacteria bacterium]|nr:rod shape-determining protein RodA [Pseudomonadota bacterium]MBU1741318.1 rod shape-determining protein RodA [Pseudomonadota bacterium]
MSFDRRLISNFEWPLLLLVLAAAAMGVVNLYSAVGPKPPTGTPVFLKQIYWMGIGLGVMAATVLINYKVFETTAWFLFALAVVLLVDRKSTR